METIIFLGLILLVALISLYGIKKNNNGMKTLGVRVTNLELMTKTLKEMNNPKKNTYNKKKKKKYYRPKHKDGTKKTTI